MMNYLVANTLAIIQLLQQEETLARTRALQPPPNTGGGILSQIAVASALTGRGRELSNDDKERMTRVLALVADECKSLELDAAQDRIQRIRSELRGVFFEYSALETELRVLREAMEDGLKDRHFYYYPLEKKKLLLTLFQDWNDVRTAFPSARDDILAATDCYALGQDSASVYHSMLILERGLKALSKALRVQYEQRNWQNILNDIETAITAHARLKVKKTTKRVSLLTFYAEAAKEFSHFKEAWRNHAAHGRGVYDENDAKKVLVHVRDFMKTISQRLKEAKQ